MTFQITQIDNMVCRYFNDELARAMVLAEWATSHREEYEALYLVEDAISRYCACWDYLFQVLVHVLQFQDTVIPTSAELQRMLGLQAYDIDFVPSPAGPGIRHVARSPRAAIRAISRRREQLTYLRVGTRADDFFKMARRRYASGGWLEELRGLVRSASVRRIRDIRNVSAHSHALTSDVAVEVGEPLPAPGFTVLNKNRPTAAELMTELREAHGSLERAIVLARRAVLMADIPNVRETEGVVYQADRVLCPECRMQTYIPKLPGRGDDDVRPCQNCGVWSASMRTRATVDVPEVVYVDLCRQVRDFITRNSARTAECDDPRRERQSERG